MNKFEAPFNHLENFYHGENEALHQLNEFNQTISEKRKQFLGYPCNASFNLEKFFKWWEQSSISKAPLNDVGNPHGETSYILNARFFEKEVLSFFGELFSIHPFWGYITSGGTQGNEQGLYMGRESLARYGKPILYFSEEAHYSIASLGKILGLECCVIASKITGEMDYEDLARKVQPDRPALVSLSIGTTFKGGIDRIEIINPILIDRGIKHIYYHADAALFGGYLPFLSNSQKPDLNFEKYPYDSIAISGHKFFGSPTPMGIYLTHEKHIHTLEGEYIEYIASHNITIPCSRSSLNTLIFWWIITTTTIDDFIQQTDTIIENAEYFYEKLKWRGYQAWLNPFSNTVFFKAPSLSLSKRWCLSLTTCRQLGPLAHVIIMQHVDRMVIDQFLKELEGQ